MIKSSRRILRNRMRILFLAVVAVVLGMAISRAFAAENAPTLAHAAATPDRGIAATHR